jgi:hypothetical protein
LLTLSYRFLRLLVSILSRQDTYRHSTYNGKMNAAITPEIEVKEHPNFRTINVGGVYGMPLGMHFEVIVYSEQFEVAGALSSAQMTMPPRVNRTIECRLIIDPFQAKSIVQWMTTQVDAFEKQFGHIPSAEELQQKAASNEAENEKKNKRVYQ